MTLEELLNKIQLLVEDNPDILKADVSIHHIHISKWMKIDYVYEHNNDRNLVIEIK